MYSGDYSQLARHAIAVAQGHPDAQVLVATKAKLLKPKRAARWLAGLANTAGDRQAVLLMGMRGTKPVGIKDRPSSSWLAEVRSWFPGVRPELHWEYVDHDGVEVLAVFPSSVEQPVVAFHQAQALVPWVGADGLEVAPMPTARAAASPGAPLSALAATECWIERSTTTNAGVDVDVYRGVLKLSIGPTPGVITDQSCSATLLLLQDHAPVELDVQVHPAPDPVGVERQPAGVEVHAGFAVRVFLAGALLSEGVRSTNHSARLVVSLLLPGRSVPELRSFMLHATEDNPSRWTFSTT